MSEMASGRAYYDESAKASISESARIPPQLDTLDEAVSVLGERVGVLLDRVSCVLRPDGGSALAAVTGEPRPSVSPICDRLYGLTARVGGIESVVNGGISRLDV